MEARLVAKFVHRISFRLCFGFNCLNRFFNTLSLGLVPIQMISVCPSLSLSVCLSVCLSAGFLPRQESEEFSKFTRNGTDSRSRWGRLSI